MDTTKSSSSSIFGVGWVNIILAILAAIITQNVYAGASILVLGWALGITTIISIVPIIGFIVQYFVMIWIWEALLPLLVIPASIMWIANVTFWIGIIGGLIVTIIMIIGIVAYTKS